jgi:HAD superfamily hydrolase (TIGR01509 family)
MTLINSPIQPAENGRQIATAFSWRKIDTVLLDLDGTLLDKYFDDFFWEEFLPEVFARKNHIDMPAAKFQLLNTYKKVESTLEWTDLDYWSDKLHLDIPMLKREISHLIALRPQVIEFLEYLKEQKKDTYLVTNAHPKALEIKLEKIDIAKYFTAIYSSNEIGAAKEQPEFWGRLRERLPFKRNRTLFLDDTEKVLQSARSYGFHHLVHIAQPSSRLPASFSHDFLSILNFQELMAS